MCFVGIVYVFCVHFQVACILKVCCMCFVGDCWLFVSLYVCMFVCMFCCMLLCDRCEFLVGVV